MNNYIILFNLKRDYQGFVTESQKTMNIESSTSPAKPPLFAQTPNMKEQARKAQGILRDGTPS